MRIHVARLRNVAVLLAGVTAVVHIILGSSGFAAMLGNGLESILSVLFVMTGLLICLGIAFAWLKPEFRQAIYVGGVGLMLLHLLFYIDWHVLHIIERIVGLEDLGHGHSHAAVPPEHDQPWFSYWIEASWYMTEEYSVIGATIVHLITNPVDLVTKLVEILLIASLLALRWGEKHHLSVLKWDRECIAIKPTLMIVAPGLFIVAIAVSVETYLVAAGVNPLAINLAELLGVGIIILGLGWYIGLWGLIGDTDYPPKPLGELIPGMGTGTVTWNMGVAAGYLLIGAVILTTIGGLVPADGGSHHHGGHDLEALYDDLEVNGIEVDRHWSAIHYAEYYDGDALLLFYFTDYYGEPERIEAETEIILEHIVTGIAAGRFAELEMVFVDARTPEDESYLEWEVSRAEIDAYLAGQIEWDQLVDQVEDTVEYHGE